MNVDYVRNWRMGPRPVRYDAMRSILYALGVGAGADPAELALVYEKRLQALPTMALVLADPGFWLMQPPAAVDWPKVLHGEQFLTLHRPLPATGVVDVESWTQALYDRGREKGAVLVQATRLREADGGAAIATARATLLLRGDGGFDSAAPAAPAAPARPHAMPTRAPDMAVALATRADQAMLYRLSGDLNPLHIDPDAARAAGFARPILHGLCTYGFAGRAAVKALCEGDPGRLRQLDARFTSPVYPGETLITEIWREGPGCAALRVRVAERDAVVIDYGYAEYL